MKEFFFMPCVQMRLEMSTLSERAITKLTFMWLSSRMYHIMQFEFRIGSKTFATIWTREAARFLVDRSMLFHLVNSSWCWWQLPATFYCVTGCKPIWKITRCLPFTPQHTSAFGPCWNVRFSKILWKMEHLLLRSKCFIFYNIFKTIVM